MLNRPEWDHNLCIIKDLDVGGFHVVQGIIFLEKLERSQGEIYGNFDPAVFLIEIQKKFRPSTQYRLSECTPYLRLRLSLSWHKHPSGTCDQIFITVWQLRSCFLWAPSLTRGSCQRSLSRVRVPWYSSPYITTDWLLVEFIYPWRGQHGKCWCYMTFGIIFIYPSRSFRDETYELRGPVCLGTGS
jgi:hypothetical protein